MTFNQDQGCFAVGLKNGFRVYQTQPLKLILERPFEGGVQNISMLYHSNLFSLVGTGKNLTYPQNKLNLYDDHEKTLLGSITF